MKWPDMTKEQQTYCRQLRDELWDAGVGDITLSKVVKNWNHVIAWSEDRISLAELYKIAQW